MPPLFTSSDQPSVWQVVPPSNETKHPLYQLEEYLWMISSNNAKEDETDRRHASVHEKYDEILSVAEFLFGTAQLGAALTLLDKYDTIFTKISSPHRYLWLVRGSSDLSYMCFASEDSGGPNSAAIAPATPNLCYCSCRSFLEKTTKKVASEHSLPDVCKHLLALKLMPHLELSCPHLPVSDQDFARLVLDRTMGSLNPRQSY